MLKRVTAVLCLLGLAAGFLGGCTARPGGYEPDITPTSGGSAPASTASPSPAGETGAASDLLGTTLTRGVWQDSVYTNDFADLEFVLPEGWVVATDEELASMMGLAGESLTDADQWILEAAERAAVYDALIQNPISGNNVLIYFADLSQFPGADAVTPEAYFQSTRQLLGGMEQYHYTFGEPYKQALGSREFLAMRAEEAAQSLDQYYFIRKQGHYIVGITVSIADTSQVEEILAYFK